MKNYDTVYPGALDERMFFSGMKLSDSDTFNEFQSQLKDKKYSNASECLQDSDSEYYGAYLYNLFNRRLRAIEAQLLTKQKKQLVVYSNATPPKVTNGMHWVGI